MGPFDSSSWCESYYLTVTVILTLADTASHIYLRCTYFQGAEAPNFYDDALNNITTFYLRTVLC